MFRSSSAHLQEDTVVHMQHMVLYAGVSRCQMFGLAGFIKPYSLPFEGGGWSRGSVLAFSTQVRGFKPGRSRRILRAKKNPQYAFLRRGSKAVGPMS